MPIDHQKITIWISGPQGSGKAHVSEAVSTALALVGIKVNAVRSTNEAINVPSETTH